MSKLKLKLDLKCMKANHHAEWGWLQKYPENKDDGVFNEKKDWPGNKTIEDFVVKKILKLPDSQHFHQHYCFACQVVRNKLTINDIDFRGNCELLCPITDFRKLPCDLYLSLFAKWSRATTNKERSELAKQIKNAWK